MSDKLGGPGRLYEHNQRMDVEREKVREIRSGRGLSKVSVLISLVSAVFAGLSFVAAKQALDQGRQSHLLTERVETCARLYNIADGMLDAASALATNLARGTGDREGYRDLIASAYDEFGDGANLVMLGPESLALSERELQIALHEVEAGSWMSSRAEPYQVAVDRAKRAQQGFRSNCINAVGVFREGPPQS